MGSTGARPYRRNRAKRLSMPDGDRCGPCGHGGVLLKPETDHIIPRSLGGSDDIDNLQPAHSGLNPCPTCGGTCNQTKKAHVLNVTYVSRVW
jgi:5-methylcytosine-specific restriction endonuclease McrA